MFRENQRLESILWSDEWIRIGEDGVAFIVVRMQLGQMAKVPWAQVRYTDGRIRLFNLAFCEGVELLQRRDGDD